MNPMLRLQPSEISITRSDVRAYQNRGDSSSKQHEITSSRGHIRAPIAKIRRGPERSRDEAITYNNRPEVFVRPSAAICGTTNDLGSSEDLDSGCAMSSRSFRDKDAATSEEDSDESLYVADKQRQEGNDSIGERLRSSPPDYHCFSQTTFRTTSISAMDGSISDPVPRFANLTLRSSSGFQSALSEVSVDGSCATHSPYHSSALHSRLPRFRPRSLSDPGDGAPMPTSLQVIRRRTGLAGEHTTGKQLRQKADLPCQLSSSSLCHSRQSSLPDIANDTRSFSFEDVAPARARSPRIFTSPAALEALRNTPSPLDLLARDASSRIRRARSIQQSFQTNQDVDQFHFPSFQGSSLSSYYPHASPPTAHEEFTPSVQQLRHRRGHLVFRSGQDLVPEFAVARGGRPRMNFPVYRATGPTVRMVSNNIEQENTEDMERFREQRRINWQRNNQASAGGVLDVTPPRETTVERLFI